VRNKAAIIAAMKAIYSVIYGQYSEGMRSKLNYDAPAENRTRGPTMATSDFTTKPLVLTDDVSIPCTVPHLDPQQDNNGRQDAPEEDEHNGKSSKEVSFAIRGDVVCHRCGQKDHKSPECRSSNEKCETYKATQTGNSGVT
jgi:hypothetical protein